MDERNHGTARGMTIRIGLGALIWAGLAAALPDGSMAQQDDAPVPRPNPRFEVRLEKSVLVPMRDGIHLATDVYLPIGAGETLPVVLIRTPYDKRRFRRMHPDSSEAVFFAGQGFAVVVQDTRGRFESEGEFTISYPDVEDGYDAIDWAANQPWSNGMVGGYGCSYVGDTQVMAAKSLHPAYAAMIPQAAGSSYPERGFMQVNRGVVELIGALNWFWNTGSKIRYGPRSGSGADVLAKYGDYFDPYPRLPPLDLRQAVWSLPLIDIIANAGGPPTDWENILIHGPGSSWWVDLGYITEHDRFDTPALQIDSWLDSDIAVTLDQMNVMSRQALSDRGRNNQFFIVSATLHCRSEQATANTIVGELNLGDQRRNYWQLYVDWFDYWLRGIDNGVTRMPKLQYFLMGKNEWRSAEEWPIPGTVFTRYYLRSGGRANSRFGDGVLATVPPANEPPDRFIYDPATPVPSRGAFTCCLGDRGPVDQAVVETRGDVLVYTSAPLERGIEVTGPIELLLYVSSSAKDTDFAAKLVDVFPDGTAYNVQEGIARARYRDGYADPVWLRPGDVVRVTVSLEATAHYFAAGHRIRLQVTSSNFPRWDRNLNTGGNNYDETDWIVAENVVHHSSDYPSHLVLPIVPERVPQRR